MVRVMSIRGIDTHDVLTTMDDYYSQFIEKEGVRSSYMRQQISSHLSNRRPLSLHESGLTSKVLKHLYTEGSATDQESRKTLK
jgi:hypothetical protein